MPVPLPGYEDKRIYVWFEAVIGVLLGQHRVGAARRAVPTPGRRGGSWPDGDGAVTRRTTSSARTTSRSTRSIWPAMLMGYGGLTLPYDVPANEFMTMGGQKASSSRGNVIWTHDVLDQYGADPLRYYLASTMPETRDTDFTYDELVRRNNDELVAAYGNAVHRVLTFAQRNFEGKVPQPGALTDADETMLAEVRQRIERGRQRHRGGASARWAERGDGGGPRGEPLPRRAGALEARSRRIASGAAHDRLHDDPGTQRAEGALRAVCAVLVAEAARAARLLRRCGTHAHGSLEMFLSARHCRRRRHSSPSSILLSCLRVGV